MILAHAFGARYELPLPLLLFVMGGAVVVFLSFLLVLPRPVATGETAVVVNPVPSQRGQLLLSAITIAVLAALIACGIVGSQEVPENLLPTAFWIYVWVAVPLSCGIFGDWTSRANTFAAIARLADQEKLRHAVLGGQALPWPRWLGWWPATVLYFLAVCAELIYNRTMTLPNATALTLLGYAALSALMGFLFGAPAWLARGEMFSVLFSTWPDFRGS